MAGGGSTLLGARILERTPTQVGWTLLRLASYITFTCGECGRAVHGKWAAAGATDAGGGPLYCSGCHRKRLADGSAAPQERDEVKSAAPGEPAATGATAAQVASPEPAPDLFREVLIRQVDSGEPHDVRETGSGIRWTFVVRRRHLDEGVCPVPAQAVNRVRKAKVVHLHRRRAFPTVLLAGPLKKKTAQGHVRGIQWPRSEIITGTRVTAEVDGSGRLHLSLTPLPQPVFIARRRFDYEYDPQIVVRELPLPPVRPQAGKATTSALTPLENAVLQTIRKLGYLDEEGRALLPMANLLNNLREQQGTGQAHSSEAVRAATSRLLSQRRLTWATGSCGPDGLLNHPARPGERKVRLVCYTPFVLPRRKDTPGQWRVVHLPSGTSQHGVAGHLMKIEHLGKEASDAARSAYAEAHRKAGLAGSHTLPEGHTYVRPHQRGGA